MFLPVVTKLEKNAEFTEKIRQHCFGGFAEALLRSKNAKNTSSYKVDVVQLKWRKGHRQGQMLAVFVSSVNDKGKTRE